MAVPAPASTLELGPTPPVAQAAIDELDRQLKVMRHHLKTSLEEVDRRLAAATARTIQAEARAMAAHVRAADAVDIVHQIERRLAASGHADAVDLSRRLREAIDELRQRTA